MGPRGYPRRCPSDRLMNVVCVLKTGGIYKPIDVQKLAAGVGRYLPGLNRFVCFTDDPKLNLPDVEPVQLVHRWPGWWSKIEIFRTSIFEEGEPVLFFDLDTIIVGSLHDIADHGQHWIILEDFYRAGRYGSGMMGWTANDNQHIYRDFARDPQKAMGHSPRGDQDWIERVAPHAEWWQTVIPNQIFSYKVHCQNGLPDDARVVCFHGKPKPADVKDRWVLDYWTV